MITRLHLGDQFLPVDGLTTRTSLRVQEVLDETPKAVLKWVAEAVGELNVTFVQRTPETGSRGQVFRAKQDCESEERPRATANCVCSWRFGGLLRCDRWSHLATTDSFLFF